MFNFITIEQFLVEYKREVKRSRYNNQDLKAMINDLVKELLTRKQMKFGLAVLPVRKREVNLPSDFEMITSALYMLPQDIKINESKIDELKNLGVEIEKCVCTQPTKLQGNIGDPCFEHKYEVKDFRCDNDCIINTLLHPSFVAYEDYSILHPSESKKYNTAYVMRPSMNNYYNAKYHLKGCYNLKFDTALTYMIEDKGTMSLTMDEGWVILSYLGYRTDDKGYLLIPENYYVFEAIKHMLYEKEGRKQVLNKPSDGHNKGSWRDWVSLAPRKIAAAKAELRKMRRDRFVTALESIWNSKTNQADDHGRFSIPDNSNPMF